MNVWMIMKLRHGSWMTPVPWASALLPGFGASAVFPRRRADDMLTTSLGFPTPLMFGAKLHVDDPYIYIVCIYIYLYTYTYTYIYCIHIYIYMSDCENPRFTERTSTNLGRSHRLPHVCTIMIYGKLGGYRLQETAAFIYIYMWWTMNNMWYLGIANVDIREIWWHNLEKGYR